MYDLSYVNLFVLLIIIDVEVVCWRVIGFRWKYLFCIKIMVFLFIGKVYEKLVILIVVYNFR